MTKETILPPQLRDVFNETGLRKLAERISSNYSNFEKNTFIGEILAEYPNLSFGGRIQQVKEGLIKHIPIAYSELVQVLLLSLGPEIDGEGTDGDYDFYAMPMTAVISELGLEPEYFDISMDALKEMTKRFSSEFSIRPFILKYPTETFALFNKWIRDDNCHVRRLCSEGIRPRLPLSGRLPLFQKDPTQVIKILSQLRADSTLYVRRSVANNLNDIGKDNPKAVVAALKEWKKDNTKTMDWMIGHATRSLIKAGDQGALELLGFGADPQIKGGKLEVQTPVVKLGERLEFSYSFVSQVEQSLVIDYKIHFVKANGQTKPKVFKLATKKTEKNQVITLKKSQVLKQLSTRKLYAGDHKIEIMINGQSQDLIDFSLTI